MIKIKPISGEYRHGFIVEGHSNYAERGKDIVCASVSAITQTATLGLQLFGEISILKKDGYLSVSLNDYSRDQEIILMTMLLGLTEIEEGYPEHVQVEHGGII